MKFALLFDLISEFLFCFTKCQDLSHMLVDAVVCLKINNLWWHRVENKSRFIQESMSFQWGCNKKGICEKLIYTEQQSYHIWKQQDITVFDSLRAVWVIQHTHVHLKFSKSWTKVHRCRYWMRQHWCEFGIAAVRVAVFPSGFIDSFAIIDGCLHCKRARCCLRIPFEL